MQEPPEHLQSKLVENMTAQVAEKGQTSLSVPSRTAISAVMMPCLVLPKRPFSESAAATVSWMLLIHRSETGGKWGHRVTSGMCCVLQKV